MSTARRLILTMMISAAFVAPAIVFGAGYGLPETINTVNKDNPNFLPQTVLGADTLPGAIGAVVSIALGFLGIIFFGIILYAGFNWMTAMGNTEKVDKSKDMLTGAIIGLLIILGAYALTRTIFSYLNNGANSQPEPQSYRAAHTSVS